MRLTPTILFVSILLTIESLVVAAPGFTNPFKSKKAPAPAPQQETVTNYDVEVYRNSNCKDDYVGQFSGTATAGRSYRYESSNSRCASVYSVPTGCTLYFHSDRSEHGIGRMNGPFSSGTNPQKVALRFDTVELHC